MSCGVWQLGRVRGETCEVEAANVVGDVGWRARRCFPPPSVSAPLPTCTRQRPTPLPPASTPQGMHAAVPDKARTRQWGMGKG